MNGRWALLAIVLLFCICAVGAALTVHLTVHSIATTAAAQAAEAPEIARVYITKYGSLAAAAPTIVKHITRPGLHVSIRDSQTGMTFEERLDSGRRDARRGFGHAGGRGPGRFGLLAGAIAGDSVRRVAIPGGELLIFPEPEAVLTVVRNAAVALAVAFALTVGSLWLYARSVRAEALRPLRETTGSLQRLAQRDFTPRTVVAGEGTAYGELAHAYNAAAEAVASAFTERRVAEAEMQRFIADAGHELRTPLTIVMGYLDIIDGGALTDPRIAGRVIAGMRTESARMRKLVDKLIVLARMDTPSDIEQRTHIDLVALLARVIESLEPLMTHRIDVRGVPFAHVYASEDDLAEALTNIIENALKYAPEATVAVAIERTAGEVVVTIADRGPGMTADETRNAFERFYRGDKRGEIAGSGLGLAIAKRGIERARGTIRVTSVVGEGTTFVITLPQLPIAIGEREELAHR